MSAVARLARSDLLLVSACGLWNKAGVGWNPSFTACQCHGLGIAINSSGTGLIINICYRDAYRASLVAQMVKNLSAMQEIWVRSLAWEDSPGGGHNNQLQYSCLENPMDRGAWWVTVHGVAKIQPHD